MKDLINSLLNQSDRTLSLIKAIYQKAMDLTGLHTIGHNFFLLRKKRLTLILIKIMSQIMFVTLHEFKDEFFIMTTTSQLMIFSLFYFFHLLDSVLIGYLLLFEIFIAY